MTDVVVISPPFRSHAAPLSVLGGALGAAGARVTLACAPDFTDLAQRHGLAFAELTVTRNANSGVAERTAQGRAEADRLREFLDATREGAVPALLTQARHRAADMLADPDRILREIRDLDRTARPDWYLVDQLSYPVTLAMHCLGLPYATFCPGHPSYLPAGPEAYFGLPYAWPDPLRPAPEPLAELRTAVEANDRAFTEAFRRVCARHAPGMPPPARAFALCSPHAVVFNYLDLPWLPPAPAGPEHIYAGHCSAVSGTAGLDDSWQATVDRLTAGGRRLVLVAFGTFLSARSDVLATVAEAVLSRTDASVIVAAGDRVDELLRSPGLAHASPNRLRVAGVVPQLDLLGHTSVMVHHGGNNSFGECVAAGVPALALPFSSDQFAIAHDLERAGLGLAEDPNRLDVETAGSALRRLLTADRREHRTRRTEARAAGPEYAAERLLLAMQDVSRPPQTP
ncbi:glycosyltransferase [Streptomyces sp. TLI_171]|uniref:glycosyltransferase n=1 Tax=Streptomyces sp. TLI_171 TaxID=1938859 RepID=UPI000C19B41B|nr:glycosyltransferase [Streptomyces sp. TLI_171]RKE23497.1 UDP:flavonoid glycosyltransferase YjiC (YdhE family) [Streptomyces sp. TLI_171]